VDWEDKWNLEDLAHYRASQRGFVDGKCAGVGLKSQHKVHFTRSL
jgi:hypothetical protein